MGAFMEAQLVNRKGKYVIGRKDFEIENLLKEKEELNSVISLETTTNGKRSFDYIYDLQSRLMLLGSDLWENEKTDISKNFEIDFFLKVLPCLILVLKYFLYCLS